MTPPTTRRTFLATGLALAATPALAQGRSLAFSVERDGVRIGEHRMSFSGDPGSPTVTTEVEMLVKIGAVPIYRYRHQATERWRGGRFASLSTITDANGRRRTVEAVREADAVNIAYGKKRITAAPTTAPLTHWNAQALSGPLFNPQEGKLLSVTGRRRQDNLTTPDGRRAAVLWSLRGEADIDDWYDADGAWLALRGKLKDGSVVIYRRI